MLPRLPHNPTAYDDDWEDQPGQGFFYQWVLGGLLPLVVLGWGIYAVVVREVVLHGRGAMELHGTSAAALGVAAVSLGVFLHAHYFWGNVYNQVWFAVLAKIAGATGCIAGLGVVIVRVGVLGLNS